MEFLRFIFSSFWVWLGFVVLVAAAGGAVVEIVKAIRPARKIAVYRTGDVVRVEVEGAGRGEDVYKRQQKGGGGLTPSPPPQKVHKKNRPALFCKATRSGFRR